MPQITTTNLPAATIGTAYTQSLGATEAASPTWSVVLGALPAGLTLSASGTLSGTPTQTGTASFTVRVTNAIGLSTTEALTLTVAPPAPPVWTPPVLQAEPVSVDGVSHQVIGNLGYNPATAIQQGTFVGYVEERAAVAAGATFSGEGTDSAYLSAILDGSGVGLQQHVSAVQQGQWAALYQKLGILPTWTDNTVSIPQGVAALVKTGAPALAIENYLVQLDGFSWAAAQTQAAAGFPLQSGT